MDLIGERIVQPSEGVTHGMDSHKAETYRKRNYLSSSSFFCCLFMLTMRSLM